MKAIYKTLLWATLFHLCCHSVTAQQPQQRDTIQGLDVRYYRNCYWLDSTRPARLYGNASDFDAALMVINANVQRVAFRFVPDRPLKIIGIAGAMTLDGLLFDDPFTDVDNADWPLSEENIDSIVANRRTEWFELYGTRVYDSVGNVLQDIDSLTLLGSIAWTLQDSSRFIALPVAAYRHTDTFSMPIIERYFPKAIWQDTDFYIGYTNFNNYTSPTNPNGWRNTIVRSYRVPRPTADGGFYYLRGGEMDIDACEGTIHSDPNNISNGLTVIFQYPTGETNPYEPWRFRPDSTTTPSISVLLPLIFPIVDTTGMNIFPGEPDSLVCHAVEGFRLLDQQGNMAAFAWTQGNHQGGWQLSWGEVGIAPEEGTMLNVYNNVKSITGLQDSVVYTAFVRARCNDTLFSEWSAPLRFWKGMNDTVSLLPHNTVEQLTYLYPNPAENSVTVASSFSMSLVELFALDGTKLISQPTNGIMTQIDLTTLPKGTYMLRITTPAGTAIKKLIIR